MSFLRSFPPTIIGCALVAIGVPLSMATALYWHTNGRLAMVIAILDVLYCWGMVMVVPHLWASRIKAAKTGVGQRPIDPFHKTLIGIIVVVGLITIVCALATSIFNPPWPAH